MPPLTTPPEVTDSTSGLSGVTVPLSAGVAGPLSAPPEVTGPLSAPPEVTGPLSAPPEVTDPTSARSGVTAPPE